MRDLIIQVITEESKKLLKESGIRDIKKLAKRYQMAKIYFHQDLDGVTTALAMKNYLENNGIKVVDAEIIQYGGKEFAIHKPEAQAKPTAIFARASGLCKNWLYSAQSSPVCFFIRCS